MFHKRLEIGKERMSTASFKKFRAWICSNLVEKRSERPVVVMRLEKQVQNYGTKSKITQFLHCSHAEPR